MITERYSIILILLKEIFKSLMDQLVALELMFFLK
jgi:hypothetical protein